MSQGVLLPIYSPRGAVEGMGLGLYISRQIIELHGGQLSAEWPEVGGTRIIITLLIHSPEMRA